MGGAIIFGHKLGDLALSHESGLVYSLLGWRRGDRGLIETFQGEKENESTYIWICCWARNKRVCKKDEMNDWQNYWTKKMSKRTRKKRKHSIS